MQPPSTPLREILVCEATHDELEVLFYVVVLRKGLSFELLHLSRADHCALLTDPTTLKLLERRFKLPVRVLKGANGVFLGAQTLLAERNGQIRYRPKIPKGPGRSPLC